MNTVAPLLQTTARRLIQSGSRCLGSEASQPKEAPTGDPFQTFYHRDLIVTPAGPTVRRPKPKHGDTLKFGHNYADHMVDVNWDDKKGWHRPELKPLQPFMIHPGAKVLHYAIELFEGMKAYRGVDNRIRLFRPEMNMQRMKMTAKRSALPDFDAEELIQIMSEQIQLDADWVPASSTSSLYLRPTLIGTDPTLGVGEAHMAKLFVLSGPVGAYYATGFQPVSLLADAKYCRAYSGGVGGYKMGCNYAPTIWVGQMAAAKGCQQVLWLHGDDETLTEVGTMNIFVYWINENGEEELVTPPLTSGLILPGVTRDSIIDLGRKWGEFAVNERKITMSQVRKALDEGRLLEMFGAGTACVVSPVDRILHKNQKTNTLDELHIPTMRHNPSVMQRFYDVLTDIQYGRSDLMPGWTRIVA
ncbi:unnamed protein product, partial [Mesorhabditis belari]|uniref:Branched-chain-amino-acid aminotransferase n=1 Tax=Mesorhabditis belari TaxID=2138241 RepID=A0AAF3ETK7_9BILA